jgi:hypothetical protein
MAFTKLCSNDPLVSLLRQTFQANPIKVPEERLKPLSVIFKNNGNFKFIGGLEPLLVRGEPIMADIKQSRVANVSATKTKSIDVNLGIDILEGFLQGMLVDSISVKEHFNSVSKVSFSFQNVQRQWIDIGELGRIIRDRRFDKQNAATHELLYDDAQCMVVDSIIASNNFTINVDRATEQKGTIDVGAIQKLVSARTGISIKSDSETSISFQGEVMLAFAFSCIELKVNQNAKIVFNTDVDKFFLNVSPENTLEPEQIPRVQLIDEDGLLALA